MQAAISNSLVSNLKPALHPYEVRDTRLKGFLLRVQPSGVMSFYLEYARGRRLRLGRAEALLPAEARTQAKAILAEVYQGRDPRAAQMAAKARTFRAYIDEIYAPWAAQNIRTARATTRRLCNNFPDLQDRKLNDITPWLVEKWRLARLKAGAKHITINRDLDDLKSSLSKATIWGFLEENPLRGLKRHRIDDRPPVRFLTEAEEHCLRGALDQREARLHAGRTSANAWRRARGYPLHVEFSTVAFADHLRPMVLLSLNTGMRQGELFALRWTDVDFDNSNLTVRGATAKSGRTRHIPLNTEGHSVLQDWRQQAPSPDGLIFPGRGGHPFNNVRKAWLGVLQTAAITNFRWHDLRHNFASRLVMSGVDLNTVRELLGHASYQMTLRYAHLAPAHKAAAVARLVSNVDA